MNASNVNVKEILRDLHLKQIKEYYPAQPSVLIKNDGQDKTFLVDFDQESWGIINSLRLQISVIIKGDRHVRLDVREV